MSEATTYRVVAIGGDGVGPDVVGAGQRVLDATGERFGYRIEWDERLVGGVSIDAYGVPIRDEDVAVCQAADAVFLGA
ncbi:MAG: 3-isopropylmalate dehydrogenase, partial [Chloroflexi bacterium]|nr:3-isopropylmalate dehydrogenase [Chloroflexota bacterium]